ncbi:MAG: (Fe-S)-binding protein [Myxococcales bacterium]|nr:MAG: (Fe-S)-binding protein [Myxococcales bacterium]
MNPAAMTLLLVLSLGLFAYSAARRFSLLQRAQPEPRFSVASLDELLERATKTMIYAFGQKKMPNYRWAGIAHILIFSGFMVLLLRSLMLWGRGFDPGFDFWGLLSHEHPLGIAYSFIKDLFAVLVVLGASVFVYYRVLSPQKRMTLSLEGLFILFIIITMMLADILYDGARIALSDSAEASLPMLNLIEPAGSLTAIALVSAQLSTPQLHFLMELGFWWHSAFVLIFLNLLPYSKHFHIITAIPNVFSESNLAKGALPKVEDLEGKVEREEALGFREISNLSWKDVLDLYTCTECGRCSDNCPAYTTDKKLSPKHLTVALRDHLYDSEQALLGENPIAKLSSMVSARAETANDKTIHGDPPKDAYFRSATPLGLVPGILAPEVIWACTTCRACEEQCPVNISYVDKIVKLRREKVMIDAEFPTELQKPFNGIESNGNPWNLSAMDRPAWAEGLDVPLIEQNPNASVLYWVGCAASYDDRAKKIARATVRLLNKAHVDFAILGKLEKCTGDPARRAGNEYLFQVIAEQNVSILKKHGVDKKTVLTTCPHCFNTLLNEYPQFDGHFKVVHHSDYLADLLASKRLVPEKTVNARMTYHDSCYLGRYNDIYESPRAILEAIPGIELVEVEHWNRSKGLCCGAGGGQMFMEEQNDNRVNNKRTLQLLQTQADTIASACPFCMTMVSDGLKAHEKEEQIQSLDIAEVLERSVL